MESSLALLPLLAPLGLVVAALVAPRDRCSRPRAAFGATRAAATLALVVATLTAAALRAPLASPLLGHDGLGFSVRIDGLSAQSLMNDEFSQRLFHAHGVDVRMLWWTRRRVRSATGLLMSSNWHLITPILYVSQPS